MKPIDARRGGFSLIEIMAAITVLAIILYIIGAAYSSVNATWNQTANASDQNTGGRAVLAFMARELSSAVVSPEYQMEVSPEKDPYNEYQVASDRIYFCARINTPRKTSSQSHRNIMEVMYFSQAADEEDDVEAKTGFDYQKLNRAILYGTEKMCSFGRATENKFISEILTTGNNQNRVPLLSGIRRFKVTVYCLNMQNPSQAPVPMPNYSSKKDLYDGSGLLKFVPVYADLFLEVMGSDHSRVASLSGSKAPLYAEQNAERYSTRVHFANVNGYLQGVIP
jgi:prepilin-type N-terminal cleavage/methylation domain-containing protein